MHPTQTAPALKLPTAPEAPHICKPGCFYQHRISDCGVCDSEYQYAWDGELVEGGCPTCWDAYLSQCRTLLAPLIQHIAGPGRAQHLADWLEDYSCQPDDWSTALTSQTDMEKWFAVYMQEQLDALTARVRDSRWLRQAS